MPYYRSEENYTAKEKGKLAKCIEVFDVSPILEAIQKEPPLNVVTPEFFNSLIEACNRECLLLIKNQILQPVFGSERTSCYLYSTVGFIVNEIRIEDLHVSIDSYMLQANL